MRYIFIFCYLLSSTSFGAIVRYDLNMSYSKNNKKHNSHSTLKTITGKKFKITNNEYIAELVSSINPNDPYQNNNQSIVVNANIYKLINNKKVLLAKPELLTMIGKEIQINIDVENSDETINLSINPKEYISN